MKPNTFYKKYSNLPIPKRTIAVDVKMADGNYQGITPFECYEAINKWTSIIANANRELKIWLTLAEKVLH